MDPRRHEAGSEWDQIGVADAGAGGGDSRTAGPVGVARRVGATGYSGADL